MTRGAGFVLLLLSLKCWPRGDDIDGRGLVNTPLRTVLVLHAVIALLLVGLAYERVSASKISQQTRSHFVPQRLEKETT
jgi:hypothetical protein